MTQSLAATKSIGNWSTTDFGGLGATSMQKSEALYIPQVTDRFSKSSALDDKVRHEIARGISERAERMNAEHSVRFL